MSIIPRLNGPASLILLFSASVTFYSSLLQTNAQTQGPKPQLVVTQQGVPLLFDPAHQPPIRYEDKEVSIQLTKEQWNLKEDWKLTVTVQRKGAAAQRILLPHEMAQANEIRRAVDDKAVIVGMLNGDAWIFSVLDLKTYKVIDTVWCYSPAVSPDGRYITFIKFFPTHFVQEVEDHYMLYDLSLSPLQNRPPRAGAAARIDLAVRAGICVYPPGLANQDADNTNVAHEDAHFIASQGFFWRPDSSAYLFADQYRNRLYLLLVQVAKPRPATITSSLEIPTQQICAGVHKEHCDIQLAAIQFEPPGVEATFRGYGSDAALHETLGFRYEQFHRVE